MTETKSENLNALIKLLPDTKPGEIIENSNKDYTVENILRDKEANPLKLLGSLYALRHLLIYVSSKYNDKIKSEILYIMGKDKMQKVWLQCYERSSLNSLLKCTLAGNPVALDFVETLDETIEETIYILNNSRITNF